MKKWLYLSLSIIIVCLALFLRLYKIENRAPFDWDQNRDYLAAAQIASGKPTLIGPVAKGEGGFFLGPLYYYLLLPGYLLSDGNPVSLPITSSVIDVAAIVAILILLPKRLGRGKSLILALVWSLSWFAVESARISWNVSLIPLWSILYLFALSTKKPLSLVGLGAFGILLGLTWHIHAALIPIALVTTMIVVRKLHLSFSRSLLIVAGYLIPLIPLILFDLRHVGLERNLISQFMTAQAGGTSPWTQVSVSVLSRFGKNTVAILSAESGLHLGWGIALTLLSLVAILRGTKLTSLSGVLVLANLAMVIYLREVGFPEYYLALGYLTILIILQGLLTHFKKLSLPLTAIAIVLFGYSNLRAYSTAPTGFALVHKIAIAEAIDSRADSIDIRYDLPLGRDSGITPLLERSGVKVKLGAKFQAVVSESSADSLFIDGEITKDLGRYGDFRLGYRVVQ